MVNSTTRREEALRSALDRLNVPMMICDESQETVKTHVHNIFEKSGTHSRAEFLAAVLRTK
jgi:DNA-binding CsgD family transcriptional regulator